MSMQVLEACELIPDIQAMPSGDATRITDCGDNLSGGQRARVSLARTLYAHSDVYLLDNCLAALDGSVANCVLRSMLHSPLMSHATIIMVSSHQPSIDASDFVIAMEHGRAASVVGQSGRGPAPVNNCKDNPRGRSAASPIKRPLALAQLSSKRSRSDEAGGRGVWMEDAWERCLSARDRLENQYEGCNAALGVPPVSVVGHAGEANSSCNDSPPGAAKKSGDDYGTQRHTLTLAVEVPAGAAASDAAVPYRGVSPPQARPTHVVCPPRALPTADCCVVAQPARIPPVDSGQA